MTERASRTPCISGDLMIRPACRIKVMIPLFSILIPAVDTRFRHGVPPVVSELMRQAAPFGGKVEVLCLLDNRIRSIGAKRQALLDAANGEYVAYVDDDDSVSGDYAAKIMGAIERDRPDVVCFVQESWVNNAGPYFVRFTPGAANEQVRLGGVAVRPPWHVCAWRRSIAVLSEFPCTNYGEDWDWASRLQERILRHSFIDSVLHYYIHDAEKSEAK